jgi:hypothetical protein
MFIVPTAVMTCMLITLLLSVMHRMAAVLVKCGS